MTRKSKRTIAPAPDAIDHSDHSDHWSFDEPDDDDVAYTPLAGGSLFELTTSLQTLVQDLTQGMSIVSERLAALEERADPSRLTEAVHELGRELARTDDGMSQRLAALDERAGAEHALLTTTHDIAADVARWTTDVAARLTALEQRPDPTEGLRAALDNVASTLADVTTRLTTLESQRIDPTEALAEVERKLDELVAAGAARESVAGVQRETAALRDDVEGVHADVRVLTMRMRRLTEALLGGPSS